MKNGTSILVKGIFKLVMTLTGIFLIMISLRCGKINAPADLLPPEIPANFTLIGGGDGQAHFRWSRNIEPDFDKYQIYRAVGDPLLFSKISETRQNEFVDVFLSYAVTYYYYITAIDFSENESAPTGIIDVRPINISSPPSPSNVRVQGHHYPNLNLIEFVITWTPPNVSDLWQFRIYRATHPDFQVDSTTLIDSTNVAIYYDRSAKPGDHFYYRVICVDFGLKTSAPSTPAGDRILQRVELINPSNRIEFTSPFQFTWKSVAHAVGYQVIVARAPLADIIWTSPKITDTTAIYSSPGFSSNLIYYWWVGAFSKNDTTITEKIKINTEINARSSIWTFFVR